MRAGLLVLGGAAVVAAVCFLPYVGEPMVPCTITVTQKVSVSQSAPLMLEEVRRSGGCPRAAGPASEARFALARIAMQGSRLR